MENKWEPLADGITFLHVVGGTIYRSHEGQFVFAPDPKEFATAIALEIKKAIHELADEQEKKAKEAEERYAKERAAFASRAGGPR